MTAERLPNILELTPLDATFREHPHQVLDKLRSRAKDGTLIEYVRENIGSCQ